MLALNILDKRIWVKGLSLECPLGEALDDCPLNGLRQLPSSLINHTINNLVDEQIHNIIHVHQHCLAERLNAIKHSK
jgi:hypothetical protein